MLGQNTYNLNSENFDFVRTKVFLKNNISCPLKNDGQLEVAVKESVSDKQECAFHFKTSTNTTLLSYIGVSRAQLKSNLDINKILKDEKLSKIFSSIFISLNINNSSDIYYIFINPTQRIKYNHLNDLIKHLKNILIQDEYQYLSQKLIQTYYNHLYLLDKMQQAILHHQEIFKTIFEGMGALSEQEFSNQFRMMKDEYGSLLKTDTKPLPENLFKIPTTRPYSALSKHDTFLLRANSVSNPKNNYSHLFIQNEDGRWLRERTIHELFNARCIGRKKNQKGKPYYFNMQEFMNNQDHFKCLKSRLRLMLRPKDFPGTFDESIALKVYRQAEMISGGELLKSIADPSIGWGNRGVAAAGLCSETRAISFYGQDPQYANQEYKLAIDRLFGKLKRETKGRFKYTLKSGESEKSNSISTWLENGISVDVVFSSPPYFNYENYQRGLQASKHYKHKEDWAESFYKPYVMNFSRLLVNNGIIAINIPSCEYKDAELWRNVHKKLEDIKFLKLEQEVKFTQQTMSDYNKRIARPKSKKVESILFYRKVEMLHQLLPSMPQTSSNEELKAEDFQAPRTLLCLFNDRQKLKILNSDVKVNQVQSNPSRSLLTSADPSLLFAKGLALEHQKDRPIRSLWRLS